MTDDYELAISAYISADVAESMIRRTVETQTGKKISSVQADFKDGKFRGFQVTFENEQPLPGIRNNSTPDRSFKLTTYS
jgi:hypothetical protein